MIEYIILLVWLIAAGLCLQRKDFIVNLLGAVFIAALSLSVFEDYPTLYGGTWFILGSFIISIIGIINVIRKVFQ